MLTVTLPLYISGINHELVLFPPLLAFTQTPSVHTHISTNTRTTAVHLHSHRSSVPPGGDQTVVTGLTLQTSTVSSRASISSLLDSSRSSVIIFMSDINLLMTRFGRAAEHGRVKAADCGFTYTVLLSPSPVWQLSGTSVKLHARQTTRFRFQLLKIKAADNSVTSVWTSK